MIPPPYYPAVVSFRRRLLLSLPLLLTVARVGAQTRPAAPASASFEELARRADAARAAGALDEASRLYREAVALRPQWTQGLWALGTIAYDRNRWAECRDAFRRLREQGQPVARLEKRRCRIA